MRRLTCLRRSLGGSGSIARALLARSLWTGVSIAVVSLAPSAAEAQTTTTGVLTGTVTDSVTKRGLPDVVVEVAGATGEQVVVTDGSGGYRIPNLAPGTYSVRITTDGYRPQGSTVTLNAQQTIRLNITLAPVALQAEEVVVVGKAPTVDVASTQTGVVMTKEFTSRVALSRPGSKGGAARSFESIAEVAPGAKNDDYGVSINGTTSPENQYIVDGMSVNNPAYGIVGTPLSIEFVKEVSVIAGGYLPEYGRSTGGVLNVVTKSGTNEYRGSAFFNFSPGALEGDRRRVRSVGQTMSTDRNVELIHDFGADIGGPILKDKLFFYGGVSFNFTRYRIEQNLNRRRFDASKPILDPGSPYNADGTPNVIGNDFLTDENGDPVVERIPGTREVRPAKERGIQYIGKLTYAMNADNQLELSIFGASSDSGGNGGWGIDPTNGGTEGAGGDYTAWAHKYVSEATGATLKWSSAFDNKSFLIDATLGWHHQRSARLPSDGSEIGSQKGLSGMPSTVYQKFSPYHTDITDVRRVPRMPDGSIACQGPVRGVGPDPDPTVDSDGDGNPANDPGPQIIRDPQCPAVDYFAGGPDFIDEQVMDRVHGKVIATKLFQGFGHHVVKGGLDVEYMTYSHTKAYSGRVRFAENGTGSALNDQRAYGFLTGPDRAVVQDLQRASSTSTSIGAFVQDSWALFDRVTLNLGVRWDSQFLFGDDGKLGMALPYQFAPRVGVVYDITQQGRSKIYASFARYYESIPLNLVDRAFPGESQVGSRHRTKLDTTNPGHLPVCDPQVPGAGAGLCQSDGPDGIPGTADDTRVSRARVFGNSFDPNQYWNATGASKVPVDPNLQPQSQDELVIGGEYEVFPDGRLGVQYTHRYLVDVIEDMSRDEATTYFIGNPGSGIAKDFPRARRDYDGIALFFTKSFSDKWLAQVSYTLSFLRGNIAGLYRPETAQLDPNINSDFDLKSLTVNRYGPLPGDTTHEFKAYLARDFPLSDFFGGPDNMGINLGVGYRGTSGNPTSFLGNHPLYGQSEVHLLPRGSGDRLPFIHRFDTHLQYDVRLSKNSAFSVYMDIFNLFNFQQYDLVDENYTYGDVRPIVDGKPIRTAQGKLEPNPAQLKNVDGSDFNPETDRNPNFGKPLRFQSPRTFRFGARVTF